MSLATLTEVVANHSNPGVLANGAIAVSPTTDWVVVRPAATVNAADNSGSAIVDPNTSITTSNKLLVGGVGTGIRVRLNYLSGTLTTDPVIQVFGVDANNVPEPLLDSTGTHELTLSEAAADIDDGTNSYTAAKEIDCKGNKWIVIGVKTAAAGTAEATMTISARII